MFKRIRNALFDSPEQFRQLLTVGLLLAMLGVLYETLNYVGGITTDTDSSAAGRHAGIEQTLRQLPPAQPY